MFVPTTIDELGAKALLAITEQAQIEGKRATKELVEEAREHRASDVYIHNTMLIAAAFCMNNRYVDGLVTGNRVIPRCTCKWKTVWRKRDISNHRRIWNNSLRIVWNDKSCGWQGFFCKNGCCDDRCRGENG